MRIVRGLQYTAGTNKEAWDYEVYTSGKLGKASEYLEQFKDRPFVTDLSIESPFLFLAKGRDFAQLITSRNSSGTLIHLLNLLLYPLRKVLGAVIDADKLRYGFHGMTTVGHTFLNDDRKLTIMFHYDSYKVKGKKYSKEDFQALVMEDLERIIIPKVQDFLVEHLGRSRNDLASQTVRQRSLSATPTHIVEARSGE